MIRAQVETGCWINAPYAVSTHFQTVIDQQPACYMRGVLFYAHCHPLAPSEGALDVEFKSPRQSQFYVMLGCQNSPQMVRMSTKLHRGIKQ